MTDMSVEVLQALARGVFNKTFPVTEGREGSARKVPAGTMFAIDQAGIHTFVTAYHVVEGDLPKYFFGQGRPPHRWPTSYQKLAPVSSAFPVDADIAYGAVDVGADVDGFTSDEVGLRWPTTEGMTLMAVGCPVSKAKFRMAAEELRGKMAFVSGSVIADIDYPAMKLDSRVHIAIRYDPSAMTDPAGRAVVGPDPRGMSGGPLLAPALKTFSDGSTKSVLLVVGVIIEQRKAPAHAIVATRIDHVLGAMGVAAADSLLYRAVQVPPSPLIAPTFG